MMRLDAEWIAYLARVPLWIGYGGLEFVGLCREAGCVDFVTDPWGCAELGARIAPHIPAGILAGIGVRRFPGRLVGPTATAELTPREEELLDHLLLNAGVTVDRLILADERNGRSLDMSISRLRTKLTAVSPALTIVSDRGRGYRLLVDVNVDNRWKNRSAAIESPDSAQFRS